MADATVLIVDDDADIRNLLSEYLESNGLKALGAAHGGEMQRILQSSRIDLVVLDLNLPGKNGLDLCREIRTQSGLPIIMLTAKTAPIDRVVGLESGADDYVCKPFEPLELLSRIRSVLRRTRMAVEGDKEARTPSRIGFLGWTLDCVARHLISPAGAIISLSGVEYRLLLTFLEHPNRVMSRDMLMDIMHGREAGPFDRAIDLQVSRLRQKIEVDSKNPAIIKTVRSEGYVLASTVVIEF